MERPLNEILGWSSIRLGCRASSKAEAIALCGDLLVEIGAAEPPYADAMFEREKSISTYLGEGFAIPHGTDASRIHVRSTALGFLQFPDGVDWDGQRVHVCIPIASNSEEHIHILASLAEVLMDENAAAKLRTATSPQQVLDLLTGGQP